MTDKPASFLFKDCPKCGCNMTMADEFGACCAMAECDWTVEGEAAESFIIAAYAEME